MTMKGLSCRKDEGKGKLEVESQIVVATGRQSEDARISKFRGRIQDL